MDDKDIRVDWLDLFRFIWSKRVIIIFVLVATVIISIITTSDFKRQYLVKIPYITVFGWSHVDLVNKTSGEWRVISTKDKNLVDINIKGFLVHQTEDPENINTYLEKLDNISSKIGKEIRQETVSSLEILMSDTVEIQSSDSNAKSIMEKKIFLKNYDAGRKNPFKVMHPDMLPFMRHEIGIVGMKNERLGNIIFNLFIATFLLAIYIFITYLRRKS